MKRIVLPTALFCLALTALSTLPALATASKPTDSAAALPAPATDSQVIVYYFHGNRRCPTCMHIESATEQTLRARFEKELKAKRIAWQVVNFDKPENEHVIKDYGLVAQSVVLVEYRGGKQVRFKNLAKVWQLIHDENAFEAYVRDEIRAFVNGAA